MRLFQGTLTLFAGLAFLATADALPSAEAIAFRVGRAETISEGTIENAVILVEEGKITIVGEDLPIGRGVRIIDQPDWVVIPGLVNAYSRMGMDSRASSSSKPAVRASQELYADPEVYEKVVEHGITTLGLYPAGSGIPGRAVAVRALAASKEEMILAEDAYLKVVLRRNKSSKKSLREGFEKVDKYEEKKAKAKEKWDKDQEKKKKKKKSSKKSKKDDDEKDSKDDDKKSDDKESDDKKDDDKKSKSKEEAEVFVPPEVDPGTQVFMDLREKKIPALVSVSGAAEYLHFLDALGEEEIDWNLRIPISRYSNIFYVLSKERYPIDVDGIGDLEARVVIEPRITYHPETSRERNIAMELVQSGARLVLIPDRDDEPNFKSWLGDVGVCVAKGLDPQVALRAMTLEPAEMLGVEDRVGSLSAGKDANLVFLNGDPFEPTTTIQAVMLDGEIVFGEVLP